MSWRYAAARVVEIGLTLVALAATIQATVVFHLWFTRRTSVDPQPLTASTILLVELVLLVVLRSFSASVAAGWVPDDRIEMDGHERCRRLWARGRFDTVTRTPIVRMLHRAVAEPGGRFLIAAGTLLVVGTCVGAAISREALLLCLVLLGAGFITAVLWAAYGTWWFGATRIDFVGAPFSPGDPVRVEFHALGEGTRFHGLRMALVAGRARRGWLGDTSWRPIASLARIEPVIPVLTPEPGSSVQASFALPDDAPIPSIDPREVTYWFLEVAGETSGPRYRERFLVPVVARPDGPAQRRDG